MKYNLGFYIFFVNEDVFAETHGPENVAAEVHNHVYDEIQTHDVLKDENEDWCDLVGRDATLTWTKNPDDEGELCVGSQLQAVLTTTKELDAQSIEKVKELIVSHEEGGVGYMRIVGIAF